MRSGSRLSAPVQCMRMKTFPFDPAYYLDTDKAVNAYLSDALDEDEPELLRSALQTAVRAYGILAIARASGLSRTAVCDALQSDQPQDVRSVVQAAADCLAARPLD